MLRFTFDTVWNMQRSRTHYLLTNIVSPWLILEVNECLSTLHDRVLASAVLQNRISSTRILSWQMMQLIVQELLSKVEPSEYTLLQSEFLFCTFTRAALCKVWPTIICKWNCCVLSKLIMSESKRLWVSKCCFLLSFNGVSLVIIAYIVVYCMSPEIR